MKRKRSFKYIWEWTPSKIQGGKEMRINHNISAMNTYRQYNTNATFISKSMEKLSSGYRINRAADDAAGLSISEKMRSQIRGLKQAIRNAQDGISFLQTAEGALTEVSDMLTRLKELAVQVQNGTYSQEDQKNIGAEMEALGKAITDIYVNTKFNGKPVFGTQTTTGTSTGGSTTYDSDAIKAELQKLADGTTYNYFKVDGDGKWYVSADAKEWDSATAPAFAPEVPEELTADKVYGFNGSGNVQEYDGDSDDFTGSEITSFADITITAAPTAGGALEVSDTTEDAAIIYYGEDGGQSINIKAASTEKMNALTLATMDAQNNPTAVTTTLVEEAITEVNTTRAAYGALQNQLEHATNNMATTRENLQAAESRIRDVDMAEEMMEYTKNNILLQAAQAMLAQANAQPQGILQLLQ